MLSAQCKHELEHVLCKLLFTLLSALSSVILMLRTYAFSGRKKWILAVLSITLLSFVIVTIFVMSRELSRLSQ
jgi:membrane protein YdbS with pleckstrin-like domain